jgi:aminocarboxymuconate-semialdehyde decarboxylase
LRGVQLYTDIQGVPLDDPRFRPFFAKVAELDVPILLHPVRSADRPDYPTETASKFDTWRAIGWLYDTVSAMARLAFSGVFDRHPDIKIVTHHLGGFAPYAAERIREGYDKLLNAARAKNEPLGLQQHPFEYFKQFYADTITIGSVSALRCGIDFFGVDRVMFATDMPFDTQGGLKYIDVALKAMEAIDLSPADKAKIFEHNAVRVFFRLPAAT